MNGAAMLPEFDHEIANTRKMLALWTLRELATHVANLPTWTGPTFQMDELDMAQPFERWIPENTDEILAAFDKAASKARSILESVSADTLFEPWTLKSGDRVHFTMPKGAVFRSFVLNHIIHHRAQLGVYLRMCDIAIPGMYDPSADETM